jgi:tripartite-type tricarboxylate transporter receptor subunit TctC
MHRKAMVSTFCLLPLVCLISLWVAHAEAADEYPKSPIQIVVPFAPGGAVDIFWRTIGEVLDKQLKARATFINKPGGGGVAGTSAVVNAKPDGYTLLGGTSDPLNIAPVITPDIPYDIDKDLVYIAKLVVFPQLIVVRSESPFKTFEELIAFAKNNPNKLKAGLTGMNTSYFGLEMLNADAKVDITPVPFGGGGELLPNLLGGHVDLGLLSVSPIKSQVAAGKMRILAVMSMKRLPDYPQVPTTFEKGYTRTVISTGIGLLGPKGLSPEVVKKWETVTETIMKDPQIVATLTKLDYQIDFKRGDAFKKEMIDHLARFKEIFAKTGVKK